MQNINLDYNVEKNYLAHEKDISLFNSKLKGKDALFRAENIEIESGSYSGEDFAYASQNTVAKDAEFSGKNAFAYSSNTYFNNCSFKGNNALEKSIDAIVENCNISGDNFLANSKNAVVVTEKIDSRYALYHAENLLCYGEYITQVYLPESNSIIVAERIDTLINLHGAKIFAVDVKGGKNAIKINKSDLRKNLTYQEAWDEIKYLFEKYCPNEIPSKIRFPFIDIGIGQKDTKISPNYPFYFENTCDFMPPKNWITRKEEEKIHQAEIKKEKERENLTQKLKNEYLSIRGGEPSQAKGFKGLLQKTFNVSYNLKNYRVSKKMVKFLNENKSDIQGYEIKITPYLFTNPFTCWQETKNERRAKAARSLFYNLIITGGLIAGAYEISKMF